MNFSSLSGPSWGTAKSSLSADRPPASKFWPAAAEFVPGTSGRASGTWATNSASEAVIKAHGTNPDCLGPELVVASGHPHEALFAPLGTPGILDLPGAASPAGVVPADQKHGVGIGASLRVRDCLFLE